MLSKKKIFFILPSLCAGGAERVMSFVAQQLDISRFEVKLIILGFENDAVYIVDKIEVIYLNKKRLLLAIFDLFCLIRKEKPAIVMSAIGHVNVIMGLFSFAFKNIKFIGREASVVSKMSQFSNSKVKISYFLIRFFYKRLDKIVCQSQDMKNDFINNFNISDSQLMVIHNPITAMPEIMHIKNETDLMSFITVGRLSPEKGHLRLLEVLAKIDSYAFVYTIVGSGPLKSEIKETIIRLGIQDKVSFIPYTSKVLELLSENDYFLQGSYVEGFPNALLESCTVGTPVLAFNVPGGTKEIVEQGINGFIVEDELEFWTVLFDLDKLKRINRELVKKSVSEKFEGKAIIVKYEQLFDSLIYK
jgi:glycosyltransferase involved in cell wall biosynthesis